MNNNMFYPLENTVNSNLCVGCGICAGICPNNSLEMIINQRGCYVPKLVNDCTNCKLCINACPGDSMNFIELNEFIFNKKPRDVLLGNFIECYTGYSNDEKIRFESTSGGLITSLLIFAFEKGLIDGALVTRMSNKDVLKTESFIARSKEDLFSASGSKYAPMEISEAIKQLLNEKGKFAVVGLPCHINGIRKAEMKNKKLKDKIVLHLGLFCSHTVSFLGTEFQLHKNNIKKKEVINLTYRDCGWPGGTSITLKNGNKKFIPQFDWFALYKYFFVPSSCLLCSDETCELADISFGDAWLPEITAIDKVGSSVAISRTVMGESFLMGANNEGALTIKKINAEKIIESQMQPLFFKKKNLGARLVMLKLLHKKIPNNNELLLKPSLSDFLIAPIPHINVYFSSNKYFRIILKRIPLRIIHFYRYKFNKILLHNAITYYKKYNIRFKL